MKEITHFRVSTDELFEKSKIVSELFRTNDLLKMIPDIVMILNSQRQIIYCNLSLLNHLNIESVNEIVGRRPGEVFECIHAFENEAGCGSSEFCKECGAFKSIVSSLNNKKETKECRITQRNTGSALDFKVWTSPILFKDELYVLFSIRDISSQKRKEVLERIFFHDIVNTATSIKAIMELLELKIPGDFSTYRNILKNATNKLFDEINTQKQLVEAETSSLSIELSKLNSVELINEVVEIVKFYDYSKKVQIELSGELLNFDIMSDKSLLGRVLTNLLKNAVEAEFPSGKVVIGCSLQNGVTHFWINNKKFMPKEVQLQLFQRSFSTKGTGRGIGTYSVKLLTEKYLHGKVDYTSNEETGTTFNLYFPQNYDG
ncbi:MAG: GHKL domain-containing protein [Bacteroidetes bacterium]|nr:MAG: GHKL domain-containing protein [Bacteroidota bacterium]